MPSETLRQLFPSMLSVNRGCGGRRAEAELQLPDITRSAFFPLLIAAVMWETFIVRKMLAIIGANK